MTLLHHYVFFAELRAKGKKRRNRTVFTHEQLKTLEEGFAEQRYPDAKTRKLIAAKTGLLKDRVQVKISGFIAN